MSRSASMQKDAIVTARVPIELRNKGNAILKKIGSTQTELVNAAYSFLVDKGELPECSANKSDNVRGKTRKLTKAQTRELEKRRNRTTFDIPDGFWDAESDKERITDARRAAYEALS